MLRIVGRLIGLAKWLLVPERLGPAEGVPAPGARNASFWRWLFSAEALPEDPATPAGGTLPLFRWLLRMERLPREEARARQEGSSFWRGLFTPDRLGRDGKGAA
ncbi:MAG: hypothetical protein HYY17_08025 [Planctomycetes bacterium]|nr:hypothetical protein [Planctomycetota bacterium]